MSTPNPITTLRLHFPTGINLRGVMISGELLVEVMAALAELEHRAAIERRRDAWVQVNRGLHEVLYFAYGDGYRVSCLGYLGSGPDYHTALERALNAAGAP